MCLGALSVSAAEPRYYVNDHLATTVGITDAAGEIAAIEADAFGSPMSAADNAGRFTGKPYDADLGAYVFPFRNYRADEARWMSADPSGFPDGVNGVAYAPVPTAALDNDGLSKKVLWAILNPYGVGSINPWEDAIRYGWRTTDSQMRELDKLASLGTHYLDDGDEFFFGEVSFAGLSTISGFDRVYIAAVASESDHSRYVDAAGSYTQSQISSAVNGFYRFDGCYSSHNPDTEISNVAIHRVWSKSTKEFLKE